MLWKIFFRVNWTFQLQEKQHVDMTKHLFRSRRDNFDMTVEESWSESFCKSCVKQSSNLQGTTFFYFYCVWQFHLATSSLPSIFSSNLKEMERIKFQLFLKSAFWCCKHDVGLMIDLKQSKCSRNFLIFSFWWIFHHSWKLMTKQFSTTDWKEKHIWFWCSGAMRHVKTRIFN